MEQLGLHYDTVWKAILEQCDPAADIDTREQQLFACMFPGRDRQIALTEIATIERVEHPQPLVRQNAMRLTKLQDLRAEG